MKYLTRTIWILSLVSLFNDISSEMLYPIMPLFLQSIGFSSILIGLLEGMAEATAGLSKGYFGRLSDSTGKRKVFVQSGYLMSAISKPMMAAFTFPAWIFAARTADRLGKGVRTAARDAILSDETSPENKGKVFGFHRGMDTLGAAIGPSIALGFLFIKPGAYKLMFLLAFIPAMFGVLLTSFITEKQSKPSTKTAFRLTQIFDYLPASSSDYKKVLSILLFFALFNSSDLFLLLKIKSSLVDILPGNLVDKAVVGCYILYNIVFAFASFPLGHLADKIGLKVTLAWGLFIFAIVYAGFGLNTTLGGFIVLFVLYGIYAASTDGVSKALVSNIVPKNETASAIGTYTGLNSIMALLASTLAGIIWKFISPGAVFLISSAGVLLAFLALLRLRLKMETTEK